MSIKRAICAVASIGALLAVAGAAPAAAASVAYVDQGSVILSSLDGAQKVVLAGPVTNAAGETEPYLAVAQADNGRILAVRNFPGRISRFSSYRVWEPDGSSTVQGPLTAPSGFTIYVYPLSLDLTADGTFVTYGFSNSSGCCPIQLREGTYARSADGNSLDPIELSGHTWPTTFGRRLITASGSTIEVQNADAAPFGTAFTPWLDLSGLMLDLSRTDVAANGKLAAFEVTRRESGSQTVGKIGVVGIESPGGALTGTPDCFLPATGLAGEASLSQDATRIAWRDQDGLKVAGSPVTIADPCALTSPPVVLSATGRHPSIGGADIARFLPPAPPAPPAGPAPPAAPGPVAAGTTGAAGGAGTPAGSGSEAPQGATTAAGALVAALPSRVTVAALAGRSGLTVRVTPRAAGAIAITGTVPAKLVRRRGAPVVVARGTGRATRRGVVKVRVRLTATGRRNVRRLRGARLTLRIAQGSRRTTRVVKLR